MKRQHNPSARNFLSLNAGHLSAGSLERCLCWWGFSAGHCLPQTPGTDVFTALTANMLNASDLSPPPIAIPNVSWDFRFLPKIQYRKFTI